eukprot:MONOS_4568.1-p1 / transcript=MONOS_4568.1 / gene=MONOS_4568 / organism=Monocercomonoides_exilis_PA203 / gene_product= very-long-chain (3R)-3-hydroxyacyl-[acyl-carrier protein] dehydratase [EC:4.2.1.134] / transcript_product= very-long-chain (3R)-3-hydroxyacyl-[acyl-carrier protein] dehydratase [EC:4.2.1.134] / location=Mono_scaffold00122:108928-109814(-) / protein_length=213 / sequence_SO=supercontig / SO=protein_coding / is_pseudo=false
MAYNFLLFCIWAITFIVSVFSFNQDSSYRNGWKIPFLWSQIAHGVMWMDVVHAIFKVTKSNWFINAVQIMSRTMVSFVVWGIAKSNCVGWWTPMMFFSWSITEIIRYGYHVLNMASEELPKWIVSLRYSSFYILYLTGFAGESITNCMTIMRIPLSSEIGIKLPNMLNVAISIPFIIRVYTLTSAIYFPDMYKHMIVQRKKHLSTNPILPSL